MDFSPGPFVHRLDPVLFTAQGVHFWWYGLSYALGFLNINVSLRRYRTALGLTPGEVWTLTLMFSGGVLAGGRAIEVLFDEWPFYREHPILIPALWLGGMATHGLLLGAGLSTWLFCGWYGRSFRRVADALVVPGALLMGLGRIGNFIDGQIVGSLTDVPWGVKFPDHEGFRHPVVLYDGLKNILLVPYLARVRRTSPVDGAAAARFVFWYAAPRVVIDLFRDYPTHRLALGTGQTLNLIMVALGIVLLIRSHRRRRAGLQGPVPAGLQTRRVLPPFAAGIAFAGLLLLCLTIPSNWTQDVAGRYGSRHPGLQRSWIYPSIDTAPRR
jgi:phosphatidylglycerol:prolipoprotein diacylglycerol transferase